MSVQSGSDASDSSLDVDDEVPFNNDGSVDSVFIDGAVPNIASDIQDACNTIFRKWNRSKIMLVGDGRGGKTALANSIMGIPFDETESTMGINQFDCSISYTGASEGIWDIYDRPEKQLEDAIALSIKERKEKGEERIINEFPPNIAAPKLENINNDFVLKRLADNVDISAELFVSLFDFGGQPVFDVIHHLFLTPYGVYIVAFNMMWLSDGASKDDKESCMSRMKHWVNSIVMHTSELSESNNSSHTLRSAPIVFVGTHKDEVNGRDIMEDISNKIIEMFSSLNFFWDSVIQNFVEDLCFFPVSNKLGKNAGIFPDMLQKIEHKMHSLEYVTLEKPLIRLQALDQFKADTTKIFYTLDEAHQILASCGIEKIGYPEVLSFFNKMGELLWIDEDRLRDVVIIDPIKFFVTPATRVICKHVASVERGENYCHHDEIQRKCKLNFGSSWRTMLSTGYVSSELLAELLGGNHQIIIDLMIKFGLLVKVRKENHQVGAQVSDITYIVPSLLPSRKDENGKEIFELFPYSLSKTELQSSFLFCFELQRSKIAEASVEVLVESCLQSERFMPTGLFFRFLVKILEWSQLSTIRVDILPKKLYRNVVTIRFGNRVFTLRVLDDLNCICITVLECSNYAALLHRLRVIMEEVVKECFGSLSFTTMFPWDIETEDWYAVPYNSMLNAHQKGDNIYFPSGIMVSADFISDQYSKWLQLSDPTEQCDVFLSYRWGKDDKQFVNLVYDSLLDCDFRSIFWDDRSIQTSDHVQKTFAKALISAKVFVPFYSYDAMMNMQSHDADQVDNVLLEWILALECHEKRSLPILPLPYKSLKEGTKFLKFNREDFKILSTVRPTATLEKAASLLVENRITPSDFFHTNLTSVAKIVPLILEHKYELRATDHVDLKQCVRKCVEDIRKVHREISKNNATNISAQNIFWSLLRY